jgi:hypothetical protein
VDYDYLVNYDHISCHLGVWGGKDVPTNKSKLKKPMKIKNWDKLSGVTYKGYCIVNPIHNATGNMYYADILNFNLPHKPKWNLEFIMDDGYGEHVLKLLYGNGLNYTKKTELVDIRTSALFRLRYEELIDEMLNRELTSASTNGNNIVYTNGNTTYTQGSIIDTIKELQRQIDELKLDTPTNPF